MYMDTENLERYPSGSRTRAFFTQAIGCTPHTCAAGGHDTRALSTPPFCYLL